ncbi:MAG: PEP-utilizing enzyme [Patescibacteria group bacterium]|nr:PEP-utilizing enzyme [Patescibacteria group bacterium]
MNKFLLHNKDEKKRVVKGVVASKGSAQGSVRVITDLKEVSKFIEREVLVSEYTNPSYVKAMIKASAVVTDFGGITSHAAIISRELGIPCIVSAKNATKIFKNGDVVEVDANQGIVSIIKRGDE